MVSMPEPEQAASLWYSIMPPLPQYGLQAQMKPGMVEHLPPQVPRTDRSGKWEAGGAREKEKGRAQ
jgi:hypothetical protein